MAMKKNPTTYFEKYSKLLNNVVKSYRECASSYNLFSTSDYAIFNSIEKGITKFQLRYYQMDALYMLDYLLKCNDTKPEKNNYLNLSTKKTISKHLSWVMKWLPAQEKLCSWVHVFISSVRNTI